MSVLGRVNANEGKRHRGEENDVKKRSCSEEQWTRREEHWEQGRADEADAGKAGDGMGI